MHPPRCLKSFRFIALLTLIWQVTLSPAWAGGRHIAVLTTSDMHGTLMSSSDQNAPILPSRGVRGFASVVQAFRDHYGNHLLVLDAGDLFQGSMAVNQSHGMAMIDAYNALGMQFVAVGNHEFDYGPKDLQHAMQQAHFTFLSANLREAGTLHQPNWPHLQGSALITIGGIKVGLIGMTTPHTKVSTRPSYVANLDFLPPLGVLLQTSHSLRQQGAQLLILLAHMGGRCSDLEHPNDLNSCDHSRDAELFHLLEEAPAGTVDIAIGAHTHQTMGHRVHNTLVIQSAAYGKYFGWIDVAMDTQDRFDIAASQIHAAQPIDQNELFGKPLRPHAAVEAAMAPYLHRIAQASKRQLPIVLPHPLDPMQIAKLVAKAIRIRSQSDVGVQNWGGVRKPLPQGQLLFGQVYDSLPFDNSVIVLKLSGRQLLHMLYAMKARYYRHIFPALDGLRLDASGTTLLSEQDKPIDANALYQVAMNDFLAEGGDGAGNLLRDGNSEVLEQTYGLALRDVLIDYLQQHYPSSTKTK